MRSTTGRSASTARSWIPASNPACPLGPLPGSARNRPASASVYSASVSGDVGRGHAHAAVPERRSPARSRARHRCAPASAEYRRQPEPARYLGRQREVAQPRLSARRRDFRVYPVRPERRIDVPGSDLAHPPVQPPQRVGVESSPTRSGAFLSGSPHARPPGPQPGPLVRPPLPTRSRHCRRLGCRPVDHPSVWRARRPTPSSRSSSLKDPAGRIALRRERRRPVLHASRQRLRSALVAPVQLGVPTCYHRVRRTTELESYDALNTREPTQRQRSFLYAWATETRPEELFRAWAEGAYTPRRLAAALQRSGHARTKAARFLNNFETGSHRGPHA